MRKDPIKSELNIFGGRVLDREDLGTDPEVFLSRLSESIVRWRKDGTKIIWLNLHITIANFIPIAAALGFIFHHAEEDRVEMTLSLQANSHIPPYATHYIGAGGVVRKDPETMLVVAERYRRGGQRHYKLPGGALHKGEHIQDAVTREVREETGIESRFISLNCFRHWHGYRYNKSDIYFVCRLQALTFDIVRQEDEIEECLWMPVEEYLNHPDVHAFNRKVARQVLCSPGLIHDPIEGYGTPDSHEIFMPEE